MKYGSNRGVIILCILILVLVALQCQYNKQVKDSFNKLLFWGEEKFNSIGNSSSELNPNIIHYKGKCCPHDLQVHIPEEKKDGCETCSRQTCSSCPFKTCKKALDTHPKVPEKVINSCGCSSETEEVTCPETETEPEPCNAQDETSVTLDDYFNLPSKRLPIYPWYSY